MTQLAQALSASLLQFVWQGAVIAILTAAALSLLQRRSANTRYLTACTGLFVMSVLPLVTTIAALRPMNARTPGLAAAAAAHPAATLPAVAAPLDLAQNWILRIWCVGVLLFALRLVLSGRHISRLRTTGEAAEKAILARAASLADRMGLARPVAVLVSQIADCPSVAGWLRPAILLPAAVLAGMDVEQLDAILAHELAHIRRHDYLVNLLQTVVETLLFYHPAVWWLSARIRREREFCCDDLAVRYTGGAIGYARALTNLERLRSAPTLSPAANGGPLLARIRRLTGERTETAPSKFTVLAAIVAAAICFVGTTHWAKGQSRNTADVVSRAPVAYPKAARLKGIEGTVLAEVTLDAEGGVTDAHVLSGPIELRRAALQSVLGWQFGHPTAGEVRQVPIDFTKDMPNQEGVLSLGEGLLLRDVQSEQLASPEVDAVRGQLAALESQLAAAQGQRERAAEQDRLANEKPELDGLRARLATVESQLAAAQRLRESLAEQDRFSGGKTADLADVQRQLEVVNNQIREANRAQENLNRELQNAQNPEGRKLEEEIELLRTTLANLENRMPHPVDPAGDLIGHPVSTVNVIGASITSSALASLPLRHGDRWTAEAQSKLEAWSRAQGSSNPTLRLSINDVGELFVTIELR